MRVFLILDTGERCKCRPCGYSSFQTLANFESAAGAHVFNFRHGAAGARVYLILDMRKLRYGEVLMCIFLVIFRRSEAIFVVSNVFGGSSENTSENEKSADVDGHTSEENVDVQKILKIRPDNDFVFIKKYQVKLHGSSKCYK